jgi:hypothetical protein
MRMTPSARLKALLELRRQVQGNELVKKDKEGEGESQVQTHQPGGDFLLLALGLLFTQGRVGGEAQRPDPEVHGLPERPHSPQDGESEQRVLFGDAADGHLVDDHVSVGLPHGNAIAVGRAHHDPFHDSLTADKGLLAARE